MSDLLLESVKIDIKISDEMKMSTSLEKLANRLNDVTDNFTSLKNLLNGEIGIKGFIDDVGNLGSKMTSLEQGAIGAIAVFEEFTHVSDGIYALVKGTDNWIASLGEVAVSATAASVALYAAFGPAGAVVSGLTFLAAAIAGVSKAMEEMVDESIGNVILETLTRPGGVSLEEIHQQYAGTMTRIGDSFSELSSRTQVLEEADTNIRNTWLEIEKIEKAMETGVLAVEDGKTELERLFGELATTASQKFGELETTLLLAFGENGVLADAFDELGLSAQDTISTVLKLNVKVEEKIQELKKELAELDGDSEAYAEKRAQLEALTNDTDALTQAMRDYEALINEMGTIDYSDFYEEGSLDTEAVTEYLNSIATATLDAQTSVNDAMESIKASLQMEHDAAEEIGDTETAEKLLATINAIPAATDLLNSEISAKAKTLTDTIQTDLIESVNSTILNAQAEWEELGWGKKLWSSLTGGLDTEDEYVKAAIEKQVGDIGEVSDAVETALAELGVNGAGWARDASSEILGALFDSEYHYSDMGAGDYVYTLKDNFSEIIEKGLEKTKPVAYEAAAEVGSDGIIQGQADGMEENSYVAEAAALEMADNTTDSTKEGFESQSPSKVFKRIGKDVVDGLNLGIVGNIESTSETMDTYTNAIKSSFSELPVSFFKAAQISLQKFIEGLTSLENKVYSKAGSIAENVKLSIKSVLDIDASSNVMFDLGVNTMEGFLNGLSSLEDELYNKANSIAENVKTTIQSALKIHSPSQVMYELGAYTVEGFQRGLESMYGSTYHSLENFSSFLVQPIVSHYGYGLEYTSVYSSHDISRELASSSESYYVNSIIPYLVQLVQNTKESTQKEFSVNIGDREIARANYRGQRSLGRKIMAEI